MQESVHAGQGRGGHAGRAAVASAASIVPNKSSFSLSMQQARPVRLRQHSGRRRRTHGRPRDSASDRSDQHQRAVRSGATATAHLLKFSYQRSANELRNQGVGSYDLRGARVQDRSSPTTSSACPKTAPSGRRFFSESRLQLRWSETATRVGDRGADSARARRVHDAVAPSDAAAIARWTSKPPPTSTTSAACTPCAPACCSRAAGTAPTMRRTTSAPIRLRAWRTTRRAGRRTSRAGSAIRASVLELQSGVYWQDDWRFRKSLLLSYGLRYEAQTLVDGPDEFLAARHADLVAVQERPHEHSRRRGLVQRLARHSALRTDAEGRRIPAAGNERPQSDLPGSRRDRHDARRATGISSTDGLRLPASLSAPTPAIDQTLTPVDAR